MNWPRCRPSLLSGLAETWWNSSTAISRSSMAATPNLSTAKRKGCMGADQHLVVAFQKRPDRIHLAAIVRAGRVTETPSRGDGPVGPEAELAQFLVMEAGADRVLSGT